MTRCLHWFRNDLRLRDNTALNALTAQTSEWLPVFVLDPRIHSGPGVGEPRMRFLLDCLGRLSRDLEKRGVPLLVRKGLPEEVLPKLLHETRSRLLSFNEHATPFARRRDAALQQAIERSGGKVAARLDHVVFRSSEVRSKTGGAYSVYSPYRKTWWRQWHQEPRLPGRRWDPEGRYVRHWIPELRDVPDPHVHAPWESELPGDYLPPIVVHAERRELALERFSDARKSVARA